MAHHPSSVSTSARFRGREGGLWSRKVEANTVGKQAEGQKLEPEIQVPKTKLFCVFSTDFFFSFSLLHTVATISFLKSNTLVGQYVTTAQKLNAIV